MGCVLSAAAANGPQTVNTNGVPQPDMRAAALAYAAKGWPVFPCEYPTAEGCSCKLKAACGDIGKHPATWHGFKDATTDEATIRSWWRKTPRANIGLWCRDFVVLDVDPRNGGNESLEELLANESDAFDFGTLEAITGGGGRHYVFTAPDFPVTASGIGGAGLDLKAAGGYIIVEPSLHRSGRRYEWVDPDVSPAPMPGSLLRLIRDKQGADKVISFVPRQSDGPAFDMPAFIERHVKSQGWRISGPSPSPETMGGGMAWDVEDGCPFDRALLGGNPRFGVNANGGAFYVCHCCNDKHRWADFKALVGASPRTVSTSTDNAWPEPTPLEGELPPVKPFDERLLPEAFRPLGCDVADRMQVPIDFPAAVAILALAGATGRRARIQPKEHDSSWIVVPNLWGGIVAPPGQLKSPVITEITKPLRMIEGGWRKAHESAMEGYGQAMEEHELRHSAWKEKYKAASKKGLSGPERPGDPPEEPTSQRLVINDATMEALHKVMTASPGGVLVIRDELTGWLAQIDKPGREGERAFALSAWNGDTGHTIDRIGRGTVHVEHCCMSMLGGIQPARLRSYLAEALADGPSNDGLMQRFQVTVWPDTFTGSYVDRAPDPRFSETAARVFARLLGMDPEDSPIYRFTPKAQGLFQEWYIHNDSKAKSSSTHPAMAAHLAKYRSLMPSLALLFELADGGGDDVSLQHATQAAWWCDYLESHANRIYSAVVSPQIRAAQELAAKIKGRKVGADGSFAARDVYLKGWTGLDTPDLVKLAADTLADAGWVRLEATETTGRTAKRYVVNPKVWQ